jgi:hypothetical protein
MFLDEVSYNLHKNPFVKCDETGRSIMTQNMRRLPEMRTSFPVDGKRLFWMLFFSSLLIYLLAGIPAVPFHPDETTWIYMSADWDRMVSGDSVSITWSPIREKDPLQVERENAAPLTRDVIGMVRAFAKLSALSVDWNWSTSWEENQSAGAIPNPALLWVARIPQTLFLFGTAIMLAFCAGRMGGSIAASTAALLFALNAQVLLHARHAMSESLVLFGIVWALAASLALAKGKRRGMVWAVCGGIALAWAVSAKYSGILAVPAVLIGIALSVPFHPLGRWFRSCGLRLMVMVISGLVFFALLNPFYWSNPLAAGQSVLQARAELQSRQILAAQTAEPGWVLPAVPARLAGLIYEAFFAAPAYWDVPNYADDTKVSETAYRESIWSGLPQNAGVQAAWCFLVLAGIVVGVWRAIKKETARLWIPFWIWGLAIGGGILFAVPLLWQRYFLGIIPVLCVLAGVGFASLVSGLWARWKNQPVSKKAENTSAF